MPGSNAQVVDKRDFDANRSLLRDDTDSGGEEETRSRLSQSTRDSNDGLLNDVVEEIVERDRQKIAREVVRVASFAWGVISW